jgi:hypothetical protein
MQFAGPRQTDVARETRATASLSGNMIEALALHTLQCRWAIRDVRGAIGTTRLAVVGLLNRLEARLQKCSTGSMTSTS